MSILELKKIVMYEYMKPKYKEKAKLCYMETNSCIVQLKIEDIYADIANDVEGRFDISNCELNRTISKRKEQIGLMKDELHGKNNERICCMESQNSYLTGNNNGDKNQKAEKSLS